ncbi:MAG: lytic murein transglycosylase [Solirubrobacterales bacterium]
MIQGSESTRRIHLAAFVTAFLSLLVFGLTIGEKAASSSVSGPPAPARTAVAAPADTQVPAASSKTETEAEQVAAPPSAAPPLTEAPPADPGSGGVEPPATPPDSGIDGGSDGDGGDGGATPGREPAFVEQDPSLSGGVSPDGATAADGTFKLDRVNVPNFVINNFEIPPFLLPIYQACGSEYGIPWEVLASINRIETNFGTNVSTSTAGAYGWMQFIHSSWVEWGVDANGDKLKDPYNPVDAICAAGNYLQDFGYSEDPYTAIFAYNHADWYVQDILEHAKAYSSIPPEVISSLTGLTEGARFPIAAESSYEGQLSTDAAKKNGTASQDVSASAGRTSIEISAEGGAPVLAVNDGVIKGIDPESGTVVLEDVYGNQYSYAGLGSVSQTHPVPRHPDSADAAPSSEDGAPAPGGQPDASLEMGAAKATDKPTEADADTDPQVKDEGKPSDDEISEVLVDPDAAAQAAADQAAGAAASAVDGGSDEPMDVANDRRAAQEDLTARADAEQKTLNTEDMRGRTYADPLRPANQQRATVEGQSTEVNAPVSSTLGGVDGKPGDYVIYDGSKAGVYRFKPGSVNLEPLEKGSRVIAGTVLGRLTEGGTSSINFSVKPGGTETPQIDPKPFLDGWRLLAETNIYNAQGKDRFAERLGVGGVLLLSKTALQKRVLADPNISLGECDRQYIAHGAIDRRLLAALAFASERGYTLLITSMYCGREVSITTSGNISNHSRAGAADIAAINGEVVTASTQGPGSLTDQLAREFLSLQGIMAPNEVITLLDYPQAAGFAMGDHDDHLHLGYSPMAGSDIPGGSVESTLGAAQWTALTERLGQIQNPDVPTTPSQDALPAEKSDAGAPAEQSDKDK